MDKKKKNSLMDIITLKQLRKSLFKDKRVALIRLEGVILDSENVMSIKKILKAIKEIEEKEIKSLVLRINSPGGSVGASQELYDAILKIKAKGVKVVASFGDVSASGGVYVGCSADMIVSNPGTITGSIGVIVSSSNLKSLYNKIGIDSEVIKSGPYKDIMSSHRYLTDEEKVILQDMVNDTYDQFVEVVSSNRNIEKNVVKSFADGRIFTGRKALELGLVDQIGTLKDAIDLAAKLTDIQEEPKVINLTPHKSKLTQLLSSKLQNVDLMLDYSGIPMWILPRIF